MPKLNFFTAVIYQNSPKSAAASLLEKVDNYFYLGGRKAHIIQGRTKTGQTKVILSDTKSSLLARIGKVLSYFTVIIPLIMLVVKAALRSRHNFKLIDPKQKLEKGINISNITASKIQSLMPKILGVEKDDKIEWLSTGNNLVFKLADEPKLVFKISKPKLPGKGKLLTCENKKTDFRFKNMVKAKEVCIANGLDLLVVPHAKKFIVKADGNKYAFIGEKSLKFNSNESAQEELYRTTELNKTISQLSTFTAETGFNDVTWRNIPILNVPVNFEGPRKVALIDIEHMKSRSAGFTGERYLFGNGSRGLIACVAEEQLDIVIKEARKHNIITEEQAKEAKDSRLKELEEDKRLRDFYARKCITGKEPIQVDLESLGLDLTETGQISVPDVVDGKLKWEKQTVTLRKVVENLIIEINKLIQNSVDKASTKGKRDLVLSTNLESLRMYNNLGVSKWMLTKEEGKKRWINRIIEALVDKGHLFKLEKFNGTDYFIQA